MTEASSRELLSKGLVSLVPITERNRPRFQKTLEALDMVSNAQDGMLNWPEPLRALWVFGPKEANLADPGEVVGFVDVYDPEHFDKINEMLKEKKMRLYEPGQVVEFASFAKDFPNHVKEEESAVKKALSRVFFDEPFKDVRAVSVWVTHEAGNVLDPKQAQGLKKVGAVQLGSLRYAPEELVDSTAFLIPRKAFLNAIMAA